MIPIQLWRARIGLYNCRRFSSTAAPSVSSPSHCCDHFYCHNRERWKILLDNNTNVDSTPRSPLQSSLSRPLVLLLLVAAATLILVTSCTNSVPATSDRPIVELVVDPRESNMCDSLTSSAQHQSERFALILSKESLFVEKYLDSDKKKFFRSVLRDWLSRDDNKPSAAVSHTWVDTNVSVSQVSRNGAALVNSTCVRDSCSSAIIHVSHQLLVLSGDVELNPGPKHRIDDKPKMYDLQYMSYTGEDGKATNFRLKERILRNWRDFAHALRFPLHVIESIKPGEDPVEHLLTKWLQGTNNTEDPRPITWDTLIAALRHANFQEETNILEKHFIQVDTDSAQSGVEDDGMPPAKKPKEDFSTHQSASEERVLQEKLEAANRMCQEKDQEISQLKTKLQSQEAEIVSLRSNLMDIEKLLNDGLDDVAQRIQKLKEKALSHVGQNADTGLPSVPLSPSPLDNFTVHLKNVYLNTKLRHVFLVPNDKLFTPPFNVHECFAHECCMFGMPWTIGKLSMIDIGNPSYRQYNLSDGHGGSQPKLIFSPEPAKNILVVHPPGVGASLLCHEWAKGELLQRWSVVIRVQLHEKFIREDKDIDNLVCHPEHTVREAVFQKLVESKGRKVLFILDGYDQLSGKQKQACFIFHELIISKHFSQASLMVLMSQRSQHPQHDQEVVKALPEKFHKKIDQYIKILKFTDDQYTTAICNDDPDLKSALNSFLSSRSFSYFQLYTPLQCTLFTDLYCFHGKNGDKGFAPRTRTELYTDLVRTLLVQYLSSHSEYSKREWHIVEFTDLPGEVYEQFKELAQLAARGIQERVYVFDSGVPDDTLGLMYQVEEVYPGRGRSVSYSFLHLNLQEYLAAYYCSLEKPEDRLKQTIGLHNPPLQDFLSFYGKTSLQYHWQVLLFTVGITKLSWNADDLQLILQKHDHSHDRQAQFIAGSMCLLYEIQSPKLIQSVLTKTEYNYLKLEDVAKKPHELFVAGYCIPHSNRSWEYSVTQNHSHDLFKGLSMSSTSGSGKIANLRVTANQLDMLLSALIPFTNATQKIAKVTIWDSSNYCGEYVEFSKFSSCFSHLEELEVSADISDLLLPLFIDQLPEMKSLQKLIITFKGQTENLSTVCEQLQTYQIKHLEIKHDRNHSTSFSFKISSKLEFLSLSCVTLTPELAQCVGMESTALHTLELLNCNIPDNACSALIVSLKSPHCVLGKIELSPVISDDTVRVLNVLGSSSSSLKRCILKLDYTSELPHLISGLERNTTLVELTVLHVQRRTGMPFMTEIGMFSEEEMSPFIELIRVVNKNTAIRLLKVSSVLQGYSSAHSLTENCRETLQVQFVD